jgi:hypothetical protein
MRFQVIAETQELGETAPLVVFGSAAIKAVGIGIQFAACSLLAEQVLGDLR